MKQKALKFAERMSEQLYEMRSEDLPDATVTFDEKFLNETLDNPEHVKNIKLWIERSIIAKLGAEPNAYLNDTGDDYEYKYDTYNHAYLMDEYIQQQYDDKREARLEKKWKISIEIERIETDLETGDEDYYEEEIPFGIKYCDSLEDAIKLREEINKNFGEINLSLE